MPFHSCACRQASRVDFTVYQSSALPRRRSRFRKVRFCSSPSQLAGGKRLPGNPRTCFEGPFGEVLRATGPIAKAGPLRFSTKYADDETGLLYYGYRYYNPDAGRWVSQDPLAERGGPNLFAFARNAPLSMFDLLGLSAAGAAIPDAVNTPEEAKNLCNLIHNLPPDQQASWGNEDLPGVRCRAWGQAIADAKHNNDPVLVPLLNLFNNFNPNGPCQALDVHCLDCGNKVCPASYFPYGRTLWICANVTDPSQARSYLIHELTHAKQDCADRQLHQTCDQALIREMEAYHAQGWCSDFPHCLALAIGSSCSPGSYCATGDDFTFYYLMRMFLEGTVTGWQSSSPLSAKVLALPGADTSANRRSSCSTCR